MKLAVVVQRYGAEIAGGSEYLCRLIAEQLARRHEVDVLTTCARDDSTWKNRYPEGDDRIRGVTVRRSPTRVRGTPPRSRSIPTGSTATSTPPTTRRSG